MVPIASMGDIAFLLIIFFIVCSDFSRQTTVTITPPTSTYVDVLEDARISVTIDADGQIYLNGAAVDNAEAIDWGVAALVEKQVGDGDNPALVLFRCDQSVPRSIYQDVIEAIAAGGGQLAAVAEKSD